MLPVLLSPRRRADVTSDGLARPPRWEMIESATQAPLDAASSEWVRVLSGSGPEHDAGLERLHHLLVRVARSELRRRAGRTGVAGAEADDLAHQAAADALLAGGASGGGGRGGRRARAW